MQPSAELLIRSAVHDLANVLAGVRGILDLSSAERPLTPRDRARLEAVLDEGAVTLERTRNLAMELLPDAEPVPASLWADQLLEQLQPMCVIFRCQVDLAMAGEAPWDSWPGDLLQSYVRAITRQVLPHVPDGQLVLRCQSDAQGWEVRWQSQAEFPDNLLPVSSESPQDVGSRWAARVGEAMAITLAWEAGAMVARLKR